MALVSVLSFHETESHAIPWFPLRPQKSSSALLDYDTLSINELGTGPEICPSHFGTTSGPLVGSGILKFHPGVWTFDGWGVSLKCVDIHLLSRFGVWTCMDHVYCCEVGDGFSLRFMFCLIVHNCCWMHSHIHNLSRHCTFVLSIFPHI